MQLQSVAFVVLLAGVTACGPTGRPGAGDDDGNTGVDATPTGQEVCTDAFDNDGDGRADCSDVDCSGIDGCPVCGAVENPEAQPLALPDGVDAETGNPPVCSVDADCTNAVAPNCVAKVCHASYDSELNFVGFPAGATLTDPNKLLRVCVTMEHSYLYDLQMELLPPNGTRFILQKYNTDRDDADKIFLGQANDGDPVSAPVAGTGAKYCWTPSSTTPMADGPMIGPTQPIAGSIWPMLTPGDFMSDSPWASLANVPLNGVWDLRVTDLWALDNGFMFSWSIEFDPSLVSDCAGPIIL